MQFSWFQFIWTLLWVLVLQSISYKEGIEFGERREKLWRDGKWNPERVWFFGTKEKRQQIVGQLFVGLFIAAMIMGLIPLFAYEGGAS